MRHRPGILYGQNYTLFADEPPLCSNDTYRSCCGCGTYGWLRCCVSPPPLPLPLLALHLEVSQNASLGPGWRLGASPWLSGGGARWRWQLASVLTSCTHGLCWPMMCALTVVQRKNIIQKFGAQECHFARAAPLPASISGRAHGADDCNAAPQGSTGEEWARACRGATARCGRGCACRAL